MEQIQILAGSIAGIIFAAGSVDMVVKAWRTKNLRSYSLVQLILNNIGNIFYWLYVFSLPLGPIYFMHGFFSLVSLLMLIWYFAYQYPYRNPDQIKRNFRDRARNEKRLNIAMPVNSEETRKLVGVTSSGPPSRHYQRHLLVNGRE